MSHTFFIFIVEFKYKNEKKKAQVTFLVPTYKYNLVFFLRIRQKISC